MQKQREAKGVKGAKVLLPSNDEEEKFWAHCEYEIAMREKEWMLADKLTRGAILLVTKVTLVAARPPHVLLERLARSLAKEVLSHLAIAKVLQDTLDSVLETTAEEVCKEVGDGLALYRRTLEGLGNLIGRRLAICIASTG